MLFFNTWRSSPTLITAHSEIVKFRETLEQRIERRDPPLTALPEDHRPLIAKMVHERYVPPQNAFRYSTITKQLATDTTSSATKHYKRSQSTSSTSCCLPKTRTTKRQARPSARPYHWTWSNRRSNCSRPEPTTVWTQRHTGDASLRRGRFGGGRSRTSGGSGCPRRQGRRCSPGWQRGSRCVCMNYKCDWCV